MTKVLQRFNMADAKPVGSKLPTNCKLSGKQSLKTKVDKGEISGEARCVPEVDQNGKSSHCGVKGEFVEKIGPSEWDTDKPKEGNRTGWIRKESDWILCVPGVGTYL